MSKKRCILKPSEVELIREYLGLFKEVKNRENVIQ